MTKTRLSTTRELYGILGKHPDATKIQKEWNAYFSANNMDAFMDKYPTQIDDLPKRLSEMFHFDRRVYVVAPQLSSTVSPLLDSVDPAAQSINIIVNTFGVFTGYYIEDLSPQSILEFVSR